MSEEMPTRPADAVDLGAPCKYCGSKDTWVERRMEGKQIGTFSLAGAQMKFSVHTWPWAVCGGCGHESKGRITGV